MQSIFSRDYFLQILSLSAVLFIALPVCAEGEKPYMSQEYIDTMVQNVYYRFLSASESPLADSRQLEAIKHAKTVAAALKRKAQGDPNRRYVLWRVAELEQQIFLEEEEIVLKKMYKMQKEINILCDKFNAEIGRPRPNFVTLIAIHSQMLNVDPRKADELAWLIESRDRNISREVTYSLERALLASNFDKAKEEFDYVRKNRKYLFVNDETYAGFEKRIRAKLEADDMVANIETYFKEIQTTIFRKDFLDARLNIECLGNRLQEVRSILPYRQYSDHSRRVKGFAESVEAVEDSLVMENLELVHAGKSDAAIDYLDRVLRKHRVSNEKVRMVDKAIMAMPGATRTTVADQSINRELLALTAEEGADGAFSFGDVQAKLRLKQDSIRAHQAEQERLARVAYEKAHRKEIKQRQRQEMQQKKHQERTQKEVLAIYTLLEQNNVDKAAAQFEKQRARFVHYASGDVVTGLENSIALARETQKAAAKNLDKNRKKALAVSKEIYAFLAENQVDRAWARLQNLRSPLQRYSDADEFSRLERAVNEARASTRQNAAVAPGSPAPKTTTVAAAPAPKNSDASNAVPETGAYEAFDKKLAEAQDRATQDVITIYTLLEQKQVDVAYSFFRKNQIPLKTYICKDAYDILEATVLDAYNSGAETLQ